jgi:hypothetical protein
MPPVIAALRPRAAVDGEEGGGGGVEEEEARGPLLKDWPMSVKGREVERGVVAGGARLWELDLVLILILIPGGARRGTG